VTLFDSVDAFRWGDIPLTITNQERVTDDTGEGRRRTLLTLDASGQGVPLTKLTFVVGPGAFERRVSIAATNYTQVWPMLAGGWIYRTGEQLGGEHLEVSMPETRKRYFQLSIHDNNDQPIAVTSIIGHYLREELIFSARGAGPHRLYLDAREPLPRPSYDLARLLERTGQTPLTEVSFTPIAANPTFLEGGQQRPTAFTERYRGPISAALALGVIFLAALTALLLRRGRRSSDPPEEMKAQDP
jgi:hypothetical protein